MRHIIPTKNNTLISYLLLGVVMLIIMLTLFGCEKKQKNEFNKPATYWYQNMLKEVKLGNLEGADNYYASLQSEHINSPLLPEAMLILGQAHMNNEEYVLAEFYFDEYLKRFATTQNSDYINYLKLQSRYYGLKNFSKDQEFFSMSINDFDIFIEQYPNSRYIPYVETMQARFVLGQNELNKGIVNVYKKQNKKEGVKRYEERIDEELEAQSKPKPSYMPWYVRMFNW